VVQGLAHLGGRPYGPQGIVLMLPRQANTAMIASPMYFSTTPPCRSSGDRMAEK
jgi:hypothetical protein